MDGIETLGLIALDRRRLLPAAVAAGAATQIGSARAQSPGNASTNAGASAAFGPLKQIDTGVLNTGYVEAGPADGRPVILLHGWPYDIHSYVDVAPRLAAAGY